MILHLLLVILLCILYRYSISLHSYSGQNQPPMFGDFEAQRHWMEITVNLPVHEWYFNTSDNNLEMWGLDYPPLSAYHSWTCAKIAQICVPELVQLHLSRGLETSRGKLFMRLSALLTDLLVFFPAVIWTLFKLYPRHTQQRIVVAILFVLCSPAFILIDHGHFQYNSASLGLAIWAIGCFTTRYALLSCLCFTLSMCFKQMSIYFAPAFLFLMFAVCMRRATPIQRLWRILQHALVVAVTIIICFIPFLYDINQIHQILHRVFPVARGLYEDKVANFWCISHVIIKWRSIFGMTTQLGLCLLLTCAALVPNAILSFSNPSPIHLLYSLANSSFAFFIFSFQVHEKSILLPLLPLTLLCLHDPLLAIWASHIATFSMFPLLKKDGLLVPYYCLQALGAITSAALVHEHKYQSQRNIYMRYAIKMSTIIVVVCHAYFHCWSSPAKYPDLEELSFAAISFVHFVVFLGLGLSEQLKLSISSSNKTR